jgi:tape measure domain-containing protein
VSAVANVAVNLDSRGVPAKLKQIQQAASNLDRSFKGLKGSADQVKSAIQAQQGGFAKASTVQGVFSARVLNTEKAIRAQIAALREVQSSVKLNGALYQKASQQIKQYEGVLRSANKEEERSIGIRQRASKALSGLRGTLLSIGAGAAISTSFGDAQALALAQKRLARLTEEYGQFAGAQQEAERLANKFEVSVTDTSGALSNLGSRLGAQGVTLEEIVAVYEGMNSALIATGRSAAEASSASYQLAQALGSGSLTGDELKTISETLPELLNAVAAAAGKSSTEIRAMAKEGALSADLIIQATKTLRDKYEGDVAANITQTQKFRNALGGLSEAIGTELAPSITVLLEGATEMLKLFGQLPGPVKTLAAAALGLTAAFVALAPAISAVIGLLGGITATGLIAAAPWVAAAAGVAALTIATVNYYQEQAKLNALLDDGAGSTEQLKNKQSELEQKLAKARGELQGTGGEMAATGRKAARLRGEVAELQNQLNRIKGTYKIRVEIEELFKGGKAGEKLPAGYSRAKDGRLLNTVSGTTYDVRYGTVYTPPKETPKVTTGGGAAARGAGAGSKSAKPQKSIGQQVAELNEIIEVEGLISKARLASNEILVAQYEAYKRQLEIQQRGLDPQLEELELKRNGIQLDEKLKELDNARLERLRQFSQKQKELAETQNDVISNYQQETNLLEMQAQKGEAFVEKFKDINRLMMDGGLSFSEAFSQVEERTAAMAALNKEADMFQQALAGAGDIIGNQLRSAIDGLIDGTADWNNILRDTLSQLGSFFLNFGLNALAGPAGSGGILSFLGFGTRANGGPVNANEPYIVGERGPELFMPSSSGMVMSNENLQAQNRAFLDSIDTETGGTAPGDSEAEREATVATRAAIRESERIQENRMQIMSQQKEFDRRYERERIEQMASTPGKLDIKYESQVINNVEYVTREQAERMAAQSALRGRELTIGALQNSVKTRKRVGI